MTTAASTVLALPSALRDLLEVRGGLSGVAILTGPRQVPAGTDVLAIEKVRARGVRSTFGRRDEEGSFTIVADVEKGGAGEDAIEAARERCAELLDEVVAAIDPETGDATIGGTVLTSGESIEFETVDNYIGERGGAGSRGTTASVTVSFKAHVYPGES